MDLGIFSQSIIDGDKHWKLSSIDLQEKERIAKLRVCFNEEGVVCSECGSDLTVTENVVKEWHHLDLSGYQSKIEAKFPKLVCSKCNLDHKMKFPWGRDEAAYSEEFISYAKVMLNGSKSERLEGLSLKASDEDKLDPSTGGKSKLNRYDLWIIGVLGVLLVGWLVYVFIPESEIDPPNLGKDLVVNEGADYFRHIDQGADQLALFVLLNLEGVHSGKSVINDMKYYGFLEAPKSRHNKYGLPIGFTHTLVGTKDVSTMSCAACHTGGMRVDGELYNVDGAGNLIYPMEWAKYLDESVKATMKDKSKLIMFLMRALKNKNLPNNYKPENVTSDDLVRVDNDIKQKKYIPTDKANNGVEVTPEDILRISEHIRQYARSKAIDRSLDATMNGEKFDDQDFEEAYSDELEKLARNADKRYEIEGTQIEMLLLSEVHHPTSSVEKSRVISCDTEAEQANEKAREINHSLLALYRLLQEQSFFSKQVLKIVASLDNYDRSENGGGFGPGRDDAWTILSRLVAGTGQSYLGEPAPVKIPNMYTYSLYYRSTQKERKASGAGSHKDYENDYRFHIDGNTNTMMQRNILQAIAIGALVGVEDDSLSNDNLMRGSLLTRIDLDKVYEAEMFYSRIKIPTFPKLFPQYFDRDLVEKGKEVYNRKVDYTYMDAGGVSHSHSSSCASCHDAKAGTEVDVYKVGTDPKRWAFFNDSKFSDRLKAFDSLSHKSVAIQRATELHETNVGRFIYREYYNPPKSKWFPQSKGYMARPLNGVWASPPYLHNGSVRTIYQLLQPVTKREKEFYVGTRDYDTTNLGYFSRGELTDIKNSDVRRYALNKKTGVYELKTYVFEAEGVNVGHEFGVDFSEEDKRALIEYLKSLGEPDDLSPST